MDHSLLPSSNSACFPSNLVPEFDGHLPLGKFQQDLAQAWQPPTNSLLKGTKIPDTSFGFVTGRLPPAFAMDGLSTPQSFRDCSEVSGNSMASDTWDAGAGRKLSYASSVGSILPAITSQGQALSETSTGVTELVGRMEMHGSATEAISSILASSPPLSEVERLINLGSSNWGSLNATGTSGLTVDPLKGGLSIQGTNLAASCCLPDFSTDPGFAERAARFSCFSNQNYPEFAQRFSVSDGCKTLINRSAPRASDKLTATKITRMPSGHLTPRCSAPNSPVGAVASGIAQGQSCTSENLSVKAKQEAAVMEEDLKSGQKRSVKTCCSPGIDNSEGILKLSASMNESDEADISLGQEESSSCERGVCDGFAQGLTENPGKKRRIGCKSRSKDPARVANLAEVKDFETDGGTGKHPNVGDDAKEERMPNVEQTNSGNSDDSTPKSLKESSKLPEVAPKSDFIHVRARRGQATDSHSLAERVRREKISERMKFLQDLVPGCSKVTGKAVMLDEIINYVQSLQRQVEFLSMKLAAVNPRVDLNVESLFGREMFQPRLALSSALQFAPENNNSYPQLQQPQCTMQVGASCPPDVLSLGSDPAVRRTVSNPVASMKGFGDSVSQISHAWDDELQSVVQMGFAQGRLLPGQMKIEL